MCSGSIGSVGDFRDSARIKNDLQLLRSCVREGVEGWTLEGMCCRLVDWAEMGGADLMLKWCSSDHAVVMGGFGSEVWHGGIGSVCCFSRFARIINEVQLICGLLQHLTPE